MTPVRLEPAALWSRFKHSTTEPLRSPGISSMPRTIFKLELSAVPAKNNASCACHMDSDVTKPVFGFPSRSTSNQPAQLHRLSRIVEFSLKQVQIPYFAGSE